MKLSLSLLLSLACACADDIQATPDVMGVDASDPFSDSGADAGPGEPDAVADALMDTAADVGSDEPHPATIVTALEDDEYVVDTGSFGWLEVEDCISEETCYGANYVSPYGLIFLPRADDEAPSDLAPFFVDGDERAAWRLRSDEAVVLFGRTPPEMAYFGLTPYLFSRDGDELFASLGDTLNADVVGASPFDARFAYVMTSSTATSEAVTDALEEAGYAPSEITVQPYPSELLQMGRDASADVLSFLMRVALPADPDALTTYREAPPLTVLRVSAATARPADPLATLPLRPEGVLGLNESGLGGALDDLEEAIREVHAGFPLTLREVDLDGYQCIEDDRECLGDNNDTPYFASILPVTLDADERIVVFGVRHDRTDLATYVGLSVNATEGQVAIAGFTGTDAEGSAAVYLDSPESDSLFAMILARDCAGESFCVEIPTGTLGADLDETVTLLWRAYLQPGTQTGPSGDDLVAPRYLKIR